MSSDVKEFDLTSPPGRQAVGLPDGKDQFTHQSAGLSDFAVRVLLPDGKRLEFAARSVGVDSLLTDDPPTGPPTTMDIVFQASSLDAAKAHLLTTAAEFGLPVAPIAHWHAEALEVVDVPVRSRWLRTTLGYLTFEVRGSHSPTRTVVHYVLSWR